MNGQNYLIDVGGRPRKQGFYQTVVIEADNPHTAALLAKAKIRHDRDLKAITLNDPGDPPRVELHTFWELDIACDAGQLQDGRTFYPERRWWQFWKKNPRDRLISQQGVFCPEVTEQITPGP